MQILFVGNSYTYYHDMPHRLFLPMARAAGLDCCVTAVTVGGCTLARFADADDDAGRKLRETVKNCRYDLVILQEHGTQPVRRPDGFAESVRALMDLLAPQAKRFMLYAPCARQEGYPELKELGMTSAQLAQALGERYDCVGAAYGLPVAHVERAFLQYARQHPDARLYDEDRLHPSALGSALAAETILQKILSDDRTH